MSIWLWTNFSSSSLALGLTPSGASLCAQVKVLWRMACMVLITFSRVIFRSPPDFSNQAIESAAKRSPVPTKLASSLGNWIRILVGVSFLWTVLARHIRFPANKRRLFVVGLLVSWCYVLYCKCMPTKVRRDYWMPSKWTFSRLSWRDFMVTNGRDWVGRWRCCMAVSGS